MNSAFPAFAPAPGSGPLAAALAGWRAGRGGGEHHLDEASSRLLFGVGLETLQRIERGEVEPEPDLAERIARGIRFDPAAATPPGRGGRGGGDPTAEVHPAAAPPPHQSPQSGALPGAEAGGAWRSVQPEGPAFARAGGGIRMWHSAGASDFTIEEALAMRAGLDRALEGER